MRIQMFYQTVTGRVLIDFLLGLLTGYLIYLWRDNAKAPFICAASAAALGFFRLKKIGPFRNRT